jgi:hypothetical protein
VEGVVLGEQSGGGTAGETILGRLSSGLQWLVLRESSVAVRGRSRARRSTLEAISEQFSSVVLVLLLLQLTSIHTYIYIIKHYLSKKHRKGPGEKGPYVVEWTNTF